MKARVCVSILPKNMPEALNLIEKAEKAQADLVEVRLDYLEVSQSLSDLATSTKIPLIATNKLESEKGFFSGTQKQRQQTLMDAARKGFQYVDVDLANPDHKEAVADLLTLGVKPIVSYHKFDGALGVSEMQKVLEQQVTTGAEVCKIVTTANRIEDNLDVLNFVSNAAGRVKLVCFCMGEYGKVSRLLSPLFGALFTFASLEMGSQTAAGQMSISEMRTAYNLLVTNQ